MLTCTSIAVQPKSNNNNNNNKKQTINCHYDFSKRIDQSERWSICIVLLVCNKIIIQRQHCYQVSVCIIHLNKLKCKDIHVHVKVFLVFKATHLFFEHEVFYITECWILKYDWIRRRLKYILLPSVSTTHFAKGNTLNCYMHLNYALTVRRKNRFNPKEVSLVLFKTKKFSIMK